jgi:hypothetical protein
MRYLVFILLFSLGASASFAQEVYSSSGKPLDRKNPLRREEPKGFDKDKLIFGGGIIFGAGNGFLNVGVTPAVGYRFTDRFSAGIGLGYRYFQEKIPYNNIKTGLPDIYKLKTSIYSASLWSRFIVWNNIFLHLEPEMNSLETFSAGYDPTTREFVVDKDRIFVPSLLVGAGIRQPISDRVSLATSILYDVMQDKNSPYRNTIDIRLGILVGF